MAYSQFLVNPSRLLNIFLIIAILNVYQFRSVNSRQKCWKHSANKATTKYPEVHVSKLIPLVTARKLPGKETPPLAVNLTSGENGSDIVLQIPTMLDVLGLQCTASYKVQWGFESYPWIMYDTWTGASPPLRHKNESQTYTATVEFHKVQETSLQTRIPICYSVADPCVQTAVEPRSGPANTVEMNISHGSNFTIQSKSDKDQFGNNKNCTLKFGYDERLQKFYCRETDLSKPETIGKIFLRPCPDPITCDSLLTNQSNCTVQDLPPISECTVQNRCRIETSFAGKFPGVAVCHTGNAAEHSVAIPYFYALNSFNATHNKTKRYLHWNDAKPSEMLKLSKMDDVVYTNQKIQIVCNASYFYLGSGVYFTLFKQDSPAVSPNEDASIESGSKENFQQSLKMELNQLESAKETVIYEDGNINGISSKLPIVRSLQVTSFVFDAPGKYELSCFAPVWNTTQWAKVSTIIFVKESIFPEFDGGNMTVRQYYAPFKRLECFVYGVPKPELTWSRDGGTVPSEVSLVTGEQNQTLVWAVLTFPKTEFGINGNFTCAATNVAGTGKKTFVIIPADKDSSTAMWVLIGLALLVTVLIPLILYLTWKVRHQRQFIDDLTQEEVDEFINGRPEYIPFHCDMSTYAYYLPYNTLYEISRDSLEIDLQRVLGSGEYGLVLYGLYKNANPPSGNTPVVKPVAIKTTKPLTSGKEYFKALLSELKIMTYIGNHANIVNLVGACTQNIKKREVYIATEYCENGSLLAYLRINRYACENPIFYAELAPARTSSLTAETSFMNLPTSLMLGDGMKPGVPDIQYVKMEDLGNIAMNQYENIRNIKMQDLLKWSLDIATGMEFLTSKKVIHGDLAARNVLLTRDLRCKIGDFGLSRQLFHYSYYTKTAVTPLPLKWLAIECLQNFQFSAESDVWAYGVTLFEIFSIGEIPYSSVQMNGEEFLRALKHGMRLTKPAHAPDDIFELMMKCWKNDRQQRPKFADIVEFFKICISKGVST